MNATMNAVVGVTPTYRWRQPRLARGWDPIQMIGRMKILAARDGVALPPSWWLVKVVFLWENHRSGIPAYYDRLLARVFSQYTAGSTG
jgi:hypothetical protein